MKSASASCDWPAGLPFCWRRKCSRVQHARARLVGVDLDVVVIDAVRREQPDHAARGQPALADDLLEHAPRVRVQIARLLADHRVGEDVRELAGELPGVEERHPVDVARQVFERVVVEDAHAEEARHRRHVRVPAAVEAVGARLRDRQLRTLDLLARDAARDASRDRS